MTVNLSVRPEHGRIWWEKESAHMLFQDQHNDMVKDMSNEGWNNRAYDAKIIDLNLDTSYSDKQLYENIKKMKKYNEDKASVESQLEEDKNLDEVLGLIEISQFGRKFIDACCGNNLTNG